MNEQRNLEEKHLAQQSPWLLHNILSFYNEESPTNNDKEKKQHFLQNKENIKKTKKLIWRVEGHKKENMLCRSIHIYY